MSGAESAAAAGTTAPAGGSTTVGTYTGPVIVFSFAPFATTGGSIEVALPHVAGVPGRRVELFDATTDQLLGRRDIAEVGANGTAVAIAGLPKDVALKVRVSGLGATAPITAAAGAAPID